MFISKSLRASLIGTLTLSTAGTAQAQEIPYIPSKIANVTDHPFFPLSEINDGISDDIPPDYNGFISRTTSLTLGFDFGGAYNVNGIKLWDDVNVRSEGVQEFTARFYDADNNIVLTYSADGPAIGQVEASDYVIVATNVTHAEIDFTSKDLFGIEIRELDLYGSPVPGQSTMDYACYDLMDHEMASYRKDIRFEDQFGRSTSAILGQPVSLCAPANVEIRTIDITQLENHLVCYEAIDAQTNRELEHRLGIENSIENNIVVTGQLDKICLKSTKEHL